jgi:hypothetical protein
MTKKYAGAVTEAALLVCVAEFETRSALNLFKEPSPT